MSDLKVKNLEDEKVSEPEDIASNEEAENDVKDVTNKKKKKKKRNKGNIKPKLNRISCDKIIFRDITMHMHLTWFEYMTLQV